MTIFSVRHITSYRYVRDVDFGEHRLMFRPRDSFDQRLIEASLAIYPEESHEPQPQRSNRIYRVSSPPGDYAFSRRTQTKVRSVPDFVPHTNLRSLQ